MAEPLGVDSGVGSQLGGFHAVIEALMVRQKASFMHKWLNTQMRTVVIKQPGKRGPGDAAGRALGGRERPQWGLSLQPACLDLRW